MDKTLTISVAAYNVQNYLDECLSSLCLKRNLSKIEVIVVDDGSSDSTYKIARKYEEKFPYTFKVISKENGGWGSTLNTAIKIATGKYFKQLDGDDFYNTDNLEELIDFLEKDETDVVFTPYVLFNDTEKEFEKIEFDIPTKSMSLDNFLDSSSVIEMHSCIFKTSILKNNNIQMLEHCFYTDQEYMLKAFYYSKDISFFNKTIYCYRVSRDGQSVSLEGFIKHRDDHKRVILELSTFFESKDDINVFYLDRIMQLVDKQFGIYLILGNAKNELKNFDESIKEYKYYNEFKHQLKKYKKVNILHYSKFFLYTILARVYKPTNL